MFKCPSRVNVKELPKLKKDGSNKNDFFVADTIGNQRFAQNFGGYPRSDIALINEQNDLRMAEQTLARLQQFPDVQQSAKTDAEILLSHRSKYCQTPSENIRYYEQEIGRVAAKRDAEQMNAERPVSKDVEQIVDNA